MLRLLYIISRYTSLGLPELCGLAENVFELTSIPAVRDTVMDFWNIRRQTP